ncbi:UNVERIFIED_CONTAM: hypothetical protein GTU68_029117 [Idotea baltica]|nr:hypothetical protein [Idotea baltica]
MQERLQDIVNFEDYLQRNGTQVVKFYLHISKEEQRERLLARIDEPAKNWKMNPGDVRERQKWDRYREAYQDTLDKTSTPEAPWYVIPGNDKKNARLLISQIVLRHMRKLKMSFPKADGEILDQLKECREILEND